MKQSSFWSPGLYYWFISKESIVQPSYDKFWKIKPNANFDGNELLKSFELKIFE